MQEMQSFLGQEIPLEKEMTTCSSILAWKIPWTEKPGGLQSMEPQRIEHNLVTKQQYSNNIAYIYIKTPCICSKIPFLFFFPSIKYMYFIYILKMIRKSFFLPPKNTPLNLHCFPYKFFVLLLYNCPFLHCIDYTN